MLKQIFQQWLLGRMETCEQSKKNALTFIGQILFFVCAGIFLVLGTAISRYGIMMVGTFFMFLACICYCFENIAKRLFLLVFDLLIFVFLMCRPLIDILKGEVRWDWYYPDSVKFAIISVAVSLLALQIGSVVFDYCAKRREKEPMVRINTLAPKGTNLQNFRLVTFSLYLFCMVFFLIKEVDKLIFMQGRAYIEFYTDYVADYPFYIGTIAAIMPYVLSVFLATLPSKRFSFIALVLYVFSAVPQLLIGVRNPIVLNVLFAFLYYCVRDLMKDTQKWVGKFERKCILVIIPVALIGLSAYGFLRSGTVIEGQSLFYLITDLFYKQGVSFDVLCMAHNAIPLLPGGTKCYTLGPFIDNILQSRIGLVLFHTEPFPAGNSEIRAIEGHNFSHSMSYVVHSNYLQGEGYGSSYILETYADFGWIGIIIFSILLGLLLIWFLHKLSSNWVYRTFILTSMMNIFFMPRAEATGWATYLITIHFWFGLLVCVLCGWLATKLRICECICEKTKMPVAILREKWNPVSIVIQQTRESIVRRNSAIWNSVKVMILSGWNNTAGSWFAPKGEAVTRWIKRYWIKIKFWLMFKWNAVKQWTLR